MDFIRRAGADPEAREIKILDIEDNLGRLDRLGERERTFLGARYRRALAILRKGETP
jgi:hypothetical protein